MSEYRDVPDWLAKSGEAVLAIGHSTGWNEAVIERDGRRGAAFCFFTIDHDKARLAMQLLGAAGLLCETQTGPEDIEGMLPHADLLVSVAASGIVDGCRALAGCR